ncbi:hypothetical protein ACLOJK_009182 [Asimina triloba]
MWPDGTVYEGEWEKGKITGRGHMFWPSGATYEGNFSGGYLHGSGTFVEPDGSVYKGAWWMNSQHGLGRKVYCNSDSFEGSWKEGIQEGIGTYTWHTGNTYVGNWKAGKMCGRGIMKWANGDFFDGIWRDGLIHGSGLYRFADGSHYIGTWSKGLKDGQGIFFPVGSKLPPRTKWYDSVGDYDGKQSVLYHSASSNLEEFRLRKLSIKRAFSERWSFRGLFVNSGRISHRTISFDGDLRLGDSLREMPSKDARHVLSSSSYEGEQEVEDSSIPVYEREYMQGVLISEKMLNDAQVSPHKNKQRHKQKLKEAKKPGETVRQGHRNYYLMLSLQLGIRYTVGKITPVPMREVRSSDFGPRARIRMYFPRKGSQFTPPHYSISFYWKDYCPMVFRNLREMFKIDAADQCFKNRTGPPGPTGSTVNRLCNGPVLLRFFILS